MEKLAALDERLFGAKSFDIDDYYVPLPSFSPSPFVPLPPLPLSISSFSTSRPYDLNHCRSGC